MRKGLFIGINQYDYVSPLSGCNNDAMAMATCIAPTPSPSIAA